MWNRIRNIITGICVAVGILILGGAAGGMLDLMLNEEGADAGWFISLMWLATLIVAIGRGWQFAISKKEMP